MSIRTLLRKPFTNTCFAEPRDLSGKKIIVTGASTNSLGYETARQLANWGATVIVTSRTNTDKIISTLKKSLLENGVDANIDGHPLDLADSKSVGQFTNWYHQRHGDRLDVLINNAGIHLDLLSRWKQAKLSTDGHEIQWRTNYLGSVQLTHNLLPLLKKTGQRYGDARVVNVVSQLHSRASNEILFDSSRSYESWQAYGLSKLGLIHFSNELNRRFSQSDNLQSYSLHPGSPYGTYTNVADKGFEGHAIIGALRTLGAPIEKLFMTSAAEGAQTQIHCAIASAAIGGHYYVNCQVAKPTKDAEDQTAAARLWQETNAWLDKLSA